MLLVATCITAVLAFVSSSAVLAKVPLLDVGVRSRDKLVVDSEIDKVVSLAMEVPVIALVLSSSVKMGGHKKMVDIASSIIHILHNATLS